jgi:hypothetical protein
LAGGKSIVAHAGTNAWDFVSGYGHTHTTAADNHTPLGAASTDSLGDRQGEIRIIVVGLERGSAAIDDFVSGGTNLLNYMGFQGKSGVVATDGDEHEWLRRIGGW